MTLAEVQTSEHPSHGCFSCLQTRRVTHLIWGDPHNVTWSQSTWPKVLYKKKLHKRDSTEFLSGALCTGK
jgi:hypothetical protein